VPRLDAFFVLGRQQGCSDIHFTVGLPPLVRIDGELVPVKYRDLSQEEAEAMLDEILDDSHRERFQNLGSVDLSYFSPDSGRFRINVCRQARGITFVCRVIPDKIVPLEKLALPQVVASFADLTSGLVLTTGSAGTGKSTTLAAIVNEINERRTVKIVTLEDPVEFVHKSKKALIVQRELGSDVQTYSDGLRSALRQDPDVILVGELRDVETISLALEASETGHLVLGTLQSRGATQTIDRILDAFPAEAHAQIRGTLAENLRCIISQDLVRTADGRGRRAAAEILVVTPAVSRLIREGKTFQIPGVISTGRRFGMQLMDQSLLRLVTAGDVDPDEAYRLATEKRDFESFRTGGSERTTASGGAFSKAFRESTP
jgi:twitching motility protein PilT